MSKTTVRFLVLAVLTIGVGGRLLAQEPPPVTAPDLTPVLAAEAAEPALETEPTDLAPAEETADQAAGMERTVTIEPPSEQEPSVLADVAAEEEILLTPADEIPGVEIKRETADLISITLDDVALEDVVRMFTRISGANIVASATNLEGRVTVNLTDVEWKPALESILEMHQLALIERTPGTAVYSIVPKAADAPDPMLVRTIFLDYTRVNEVANVIRPVLVPSATLSEFQARNAIVVQTTAINLGEVLELVKSVDIPSKQVCVETKFLELNDEASKKLGIRWDSLDEFGMRLGAGPFTWNREVDREKTRKDTYNQFDNRQNVDTKTDLYDMFNDKYEIEKVEIVERPDGSFIEQRSLDPTHRRVDVIDSGTRADVSTLDSFSEAIREQQAAILEVDTFNVVLSALKKTDGVSVISNPKIIVTSGDTNAFFSVGEREPIIRTEIQRGTVDSPGDKQVADLATDINTEYIQDGYLRTGIDLQVIPIVKTEELIETAIMPSLRRRLTAKVVGENSWPVISVKEIRTRFTLRSGQTVAIGGLTDTSESKQESKVPLLGSIPIIGKYFFTHTEDRKAQSETIIFVTLSLASPETLREESGIPEDARLVHRELIKNRANRLNMVVDPHAEMKTPEATETETPKSTETER